MLSEETHNNLDLCDQCRANPAKIDRLYIDDMYVCRNCEYNITGALSLDINILQRALSLIAMEILRPERTDPICAIIRKALEGQKKVKICSDEDAKCHFCVQVPAEYRIQTYDYAKVCEDCAGGFTIALPLEEDTYEQIARKITAHLHEACEITPAELMSIVEKAFMDYRYTEDDYV